MVPEGKEVEGWVKWVKVGNCVVMDCDETYGGDHFVIYTDVKL